MNLYKGINGELVEVLLPLDQETDIMIGGQPAIKLTADSTDAAVEKHVPAVVKDGDKLHVQVGSTAHPMLDTHWITNIWVEYPDGSVEKKVLHPGEEPVAVFDITDKHGKATVYEYCNLHGLWKKELEL